MDIELVFWLVGTVIVLVTPLVIAQRIELDRCKGWCVAAVAGLSGSITYLFVEPRHFKLLANEYPNVFVPVFRQLPDIARQNWTGYYIAASLLSACVVAWILCAAIWKAKRNEPRVVRGTRIAPLRRRTISNWWCEYRNLVTFGSLVLQSEHETRHTLLVGSTGTGKTTILQPNIRRLLSRGRDKLLVVDSNGDVLSRFGRDGDIVLAADDARSVRWEIFNDIRSDDDCAVLAHALIPELPGNEGEWARYAQIVAEGIFLRLRRSGQELTNQRVLDALTDTPLPELKAMVAGTPAARMFEPGAEKMVASVLAIIGTYSVALQMAARSTGRVWSLRDWVQNDNDRSSVYSPYQTATSDITSPFRRLVMDLATRWACSLRESPSRRLWVVGDELAAVGYFPGLVDVAARGRAYGVCLLFAIQAISQLRKIYGKDDTETILSCMNNLIILRTQDPGTADYLSEAIGDCDVERRTRSETTPRPGWGGFFSNSSGSSTSSTTQEKIRAVLPSEIMQLPDLSGIARVVGSPWTHIRIARTARAPAVIPAHIPHVPNAIDCLPVAQESAPAFDHARATSKLRLRPMTGAEIMGGTPDALSAADTSDENRD